MGVYLPLPSAYQEVEYIESSGTQYFVVGTSFKTSYKVVIDFQMSVIGGDYIPLGIHYNSGSNNIKYGINAYSSYLKVAGGNWSNTIPEDTNRHIITIDKNVATVDGTNYTINYTNYTFSQGIGVFCYNEYYLSPQYNYKSSNKLYKLDIYDENGVHIHDVVPCYRKADGVIGVYDVIGNQFYTNAGTGTFTKGADVVMAELKNAYIGYAWTPGANTVAYRPLESNGNDYSGNGNNLSQTGTITYTTLDGVACAKGNGDASYLQNTSAALPSGGNSRTVAIWYAETSSSGTHYLVCWGEGATGKTFGLQTNAGKFRFTNNTSATTSATLTLNKWYSFIVTYSSTNQTKMYVNGVADGTQSTTLTTTAVSSSYPVRLFNRNINTTYPSSGYLSEVIIEDVEWTADEVLEYFNKTKAKYGIS